MPMSCPLPTSAGNGKMGPSGGLYRVATRAAKRLRQLFAFHADRLGPTRGRKGETMAESSLDEWSFPGAARVGWSKSRRSSSAGKPSRSTQCAIRSNVASEQSTTEATRRRAARVSVPTLEYGAPVAPHDGAQPPYPWHEAVFGTSKLLFFRPRSPGSLRPRSPCFGTQDRRPEGHGFSDCTFGVTAPPYLSAESDLR